MEYLDLISLLPLYLQKVYIYIPIDEYIYL